MYSRGDVIHQKGGDIFFVVDIATVICIQSIMTYINMLRFQAAPLVIISAVSDNDCKVILLNGQKAISDHMVSYGLIYYRCLICNLLPFTQDITLRESELTALRKQIEREYEEKVRIEESIMEKLRNQMTLDKAAQYSKKVTDKIKKRGTELVGVERKL